MSKVANLFRKIFTPTQSTQRSSATSQQRTENRAASSSETRAKRRPTELFVWLKSLFTRKNIASRTARANTGTTPIRTETQATQQPTHSRLKKSGTGTAESQKMVSRLKSILGQASFYDRSDLNVTKNYVQESTRNNVSFTISDGTKQTAKTLNLKPRQPAGYSDHLTQFCGGNQNQALQLSAVLTRNGLDIVSSSITGKDNCPWLEKSFDVSKGEAGQIKVEIKGMFVDPAGNPTKVDNVTILLPPTNNFNQPMDIENVAFHHPDLTPHAEATQS